MGGNVKTQVTPRSVNCRGRDRNLTRRSDVGKRTYSKRGRTPEEAFWLKVDRRGPDDCWPWLASLNPEGYGNLRVNGKLVRAHRFAYELLVGPIPEGLTLDHTCHNSDPNCAGGSPCRHRRCVNPRHLEPATKRQNTLNSPVAIPANNARKDRCPKGHSYAPREDGSRYCPQCRYERRVASGERTGGYGYLGPLAERTHCPHGHPWSEANTGRRKGGSRYCKECSRQRARRHHRS